MDIAKILNFQQLHGIWVEASAIYDITTGADKLCGQEAVEKGGDPQEINNWLTSDFAKLLNTFNKTAEANSYLQLNQVLSSSQAHWSQSKVAGSTGQAQ